MRRFFAVLSGLILAAAALTLQFFPAPDDTSAQSVLHDPANAYRWADLAEALSAAGEAAQARQCLSRAIALAPKVPQIWVRQANLAVQQDDADMLLVSAGRALDIVPDYDRILFSYFDLFDLPPERVIRTIGGNPRACRSWLQYLIDTGNRPAAVPVWTHLVGIGAADPSLAASWVSSLIRMENFAGALSAWAAFLGPRRGDFPDRNLLFNGDFGSDPLPGPLDWTLRTEAGAYSTERTSGAVTIQFFGKSNVAYTGLSQTGILARPARYKLVAIIQTEGITTNEGIRLAVPELGLSSAPLTGTCEPTPVTLDLAVAKPRAITVVIARNQSQKLDNRIEGTARVTRVTLSPVS